MKLIDYIRNNGYYLLMQDTSNLFKSLSDETRLRLLALLVVEEELCVCYLVDVLQLPQSTVSRHLSHLKKEGWLKDRREGVWIYYSLNKSLSSIQQFLLPVLKNFLTVTDMAIEDKERLTTILRENRYK